MGYYDCITPAVILRNVLENPGWYTPYTPYQAEIAQGRLESLLNFQTMVCDLTGMEIATASLLDEATAAAEAMTMLHRVQRRQGAAGRRNVFLASRKTLPADAGRAARPGRAARHRASRHRSRPRTRSTTRVFGALLQYPDDEGAVIDPRPFIDAAHAAGARIAVATDLLALALLMPPGEMDADVVVGNTQRFGVPMGYGGPHAAFFATRDAFVRQAPGRIIGVSVDAHGNRAYRMTLQTREQHIRREKATSNICTAQALLANIAAMYAVYHGPDGITAIAARVHGLARALAENLESPRDRADQPQVLRHALRAGAKRRTARGRVRRAALDAGLNFRYFADGRVGISLDETTRSRMSRRSSRCSRDARRVVGIERALRTVSGRRDVCGLAEPDVAVSHAPGVQHASLRNGDDALHPQPRAEGYRARHVDDSARLLHDEVERRHRDDPDHVARVLRDASVRAAGSGGRLRADLRGARPRR